MKILIPIILASLLSTSCSTKKEIETAKETTEEVTKTKVYSITFEDSTVVMKENEGTNFGPFVLTPIKNANGLCTFEIYSKTLGLWPSGLRMDIPEGMTVKEIKIRYGDSCSSCGLSVTSHKKDKTVIEKKAHDSGNTGDFVFSNTNDIAYLIFDGGEAMIYSITVTYE